LKVCCLLLCLGLVIKIPQSSTATLYIGTNNWQQGTYKPGAAALRAGTYIKAAAKARCRTAFNLLQVCSAQWLTCFFKLCHTLKQFYASKTAKNFGLKIH
jgi:hypothetical protein